MLSGTRRCNALLGLVFVIAMIAPPAMSRTVAAPATERILDDNGGRIGSYLTRYEAIRKFRPACRDRRHLRVSMHASVGRGPAQSDLRDAARGACLPRRLGPQSDGRSDQRTGNKIFVVALSDTRAPVDRATWWIAVADYLSGRAGTGGNVSELPLAAAGLSIALWPRRTLRR